MVVITPNVDQTVNTVRNNIPKFSTVYLGLQRPIFILYYDYFKTIMFAVDSYFRC